LPPSPTRRSSDLAPPTSRAEAAADQPRGRDTAMERSFNPLSPCHHMSHRRLRVRAVVEAGPKASGTASTGTEHIVLGHLFRQEISVRDLLDTFTAALAVKGVARALVG